MKIRVETKNHEIVDIELSGEWRAEPVDLHCLVGPTVVHYFTPEGFYDHAEPRPPSPAATGPRAGSRWGRRREPRAFPSRYALKP